VILLMRMVMINSGATRVIITMLPFRLQCGAGKSSQPLRFLDCRGVKDYDQTH
jgi:hypothetical protein